VGPAQRDSCSVVGDDSDYNGIRNSATAAVSELRARQRTL